MMIGDPKYTSSLVMLTSHSVYHIIVVLGSGQFMHQTELDSGQFIQQSYSVFSSYIKQS